MIGTQEIILLLIILGSYGVFAFWGYSAGSTRTIGSVGGLLLGLFLNVVGIIIVYCTKKNNPYLTPFFNQSSADELQKFKQLLDSGAITEQEYSIQKARILG